MDKVALVTGSTSGIGLSIVETLASRECDVIVTGFGEEEQIATLIDKLQSEYKAKATYLPADLTKADDICELWRQVTELYPDGVDILVNCAGIQKRELVENLSLEDWNKIVTVLLTAPFQLIQLALPYMKKKGWGRIINISSIRGLGGSPYAAAYCASKHGLLGLTKVVALETAQCGITCNAVCPGYVDTPMALMLQKSIAEENGISDSQAQQVVRNSVPTRTAVKPSQVAALVAFLCTDDASQMTGASITMDGGITAH